MGWQWHQLDHMQIICASLQTDNHASTSPLKSFALRTSEGSKSKGHILTHVRLEDGHHGVRCNTLSTQLAKKYKQQNSRGCDGFFCIDSQHEVALVQRLKSGWHNAVGAWWQLVAATHFTHVDECRRLGHRRIVLEVVYV